MSKGNNLENDLLNLIFRAAAIANIADNAGTSPLTNLWISLHTGNPGEDGTQETSECAYTSYARVAVARSASGWTESTAGATDNVAAIVFPQATGGSETATHFAVGTSETGPGKILYYGAISSPVGGLAISDGITPEFAIGVLDVTED
jgi:hypothetical protein